MKHHISLGKKGEDLAVEYLKEKGYEILERNIRYERCELDIIAKKENKVIFIEVKTRTKTTFGFPEEGVNDAKIENILTAASIYLEEYSIENEIRFDIIAIIKRASKFEIEHLKDAIIP
jgi:putative endonuclease